MSKQCEKCVFFKENFNDTELIEGMSLWSVTCKNLLIDLNDSDTLDMFREPEANCNYSCEV